MECCPSPNFFSFGPLVDVGRVSIDCPCLLRQTSANKTEHGHSLGHSLPRDAEANKKLKLKKRCWVSRDPRNRNNKREKRRNVESAVVSPKKKNSGPAMLAVMLSGDEVVVVLFLDVHLLNVFVQVVAGVLFDSGSTLDVVRRASWHVLVHRRHFVVPGDAHAEAVGQC